MKYKLYLYEVWGNTRDGYDINNWHPALVTNDGTIMNVSEVIIDVKDNDTDAKINRKLKCRGIKWDTFSEHDINGMHKNGKPFGFLRQLEA